MPFIQNAAASDISSGQFYKDPGPNSMLIQIMDPATYFPTPKKDQFYETHQFEFLDIERDDTSFDEGWRCQPAQARELVRLLKYALTYDMSVIVHCHAGICRSGAVTEVGVMMGFEDTKRYRQPNLLVKHLMMQELGLAVDENEVSLPINLSMRFDWEE